MNLSGTIFKSLLAICFMISAVGCQSAGTQRSAELSPALGNIRTVKADSTSAEQSPIVLLGQELQVSDEQDAAESSNQSVWSRLRSPTRFLLPRTDADSSSATVLEAEQGLDEGF